MGHPFHHSLTVSDLAAARKFYGELLGCEEGRSTEQWVDFDFFGNQLSLHKGPPSPPVRLGIVDGKGVLTPHFGVVLSMTEWKQLAERIKAASIAFDLEPYIRFEGQAGEQGTFFVCDPSGNAIEFKGFTEMDRLFEH